MDTTTVYSLVDPTFLDIEGDIICSGLCIGHAVDAYRLKLSGAIRGKDVQISFL